jgi:uncharacterized membrane protein (DUF485 family)
VEPPVTPGRQPDPAVYSEVESSEEFRELRRSYRMFAFPVAVAFLAWYLLYVLLSSFADGLMSTKAVGHLNVAFFLGIAQFVTTFLIAWWYARFAGARLDPRAERLKAVVENGGRPAAVPGPAAAPTTATDASPEETV